ncbi:glycerol-3-phosphate acyltransferase [bacterium]|nr:glycerol-3-phosphate acyltransferase [bacterium]
MTTGWESSPGFFAVLAAASFFWGSIPFNRVFSKGTSAHKWMTMLADYLKGALPVFLLSPEGLAFWNGGAAISAGDFLPAPLPWVVAVLLVLGHCFSPWLKFRGTQGVAPAFGALTFLSPFAALIGFLGFLLAIAIKRNIPLANLAGLGVATITHIVIEPSRKSLGVILVLLFVVLLRHEGDMDELLENPETAT